MFNERSRIEYNVTGQTLAMYPPEIGTISGTTTYSVWKGGEDLDNTAEFNGNATSDSVSTTVDAASGQSQADKRKLNLTSTANINIGDFYLVTAAADGRKEVVKCVGVATNDYILVDQDLAYDYAASDTFVGLKQSFTVDATFIQDENNINNTGRPYKVKWSYTAGGVAYRHWTYFDVVRVVTEHSVTADDLYASWPELAHSQPVHDFGEAWAPQIKEAWQQVKYDLRNEGLEVSRLMDDDINQLVKTKALLVIAEAGMTPGDLDPTSHYDIRDRNYRTELLNLVQRAKMDRGKSGVISSVTPRRPVFIR